MRRARAALLAAAALLSGCGQPLLSMQLDVPEVRITSPGHDFPATNAPFDSSVVLCEPTSTDCVVSDAEYDIGEQVPVLSERGVDVDLRLTDVALHLVPGPGGDLSGILEVLVELQDPASGGWTVVASYTKPSHAPPSDISVAGNSNLQLAPYLASGKLLARVEVSLDLAAPQPGFTANVEAGFSLVVTVSYDAFL